MGAGQHFDLCVFFSLQHATSGQCCLARTSTMTSIASDTRQYSTTGTNFSLFQTCNCVTAALTCDQVNAQLRASGGVAVFVPQKKKRRMFSGRDGPAHIQRETRLKPPPPSKRHMREEWRLHRSSTYPVLRPYITTVGVRAVTAEHRDMFRLS